MENITLYFKQGSSDKVYQVGIISKGQGYLVQFAYGRRGAALIVGAKTPTPVEYADAKAIYDKLVQQKMAKGYAPGAEASPHQTTTQPKKNTGIHCQLLNPVEEDQLPRLIEDAAFWAQEKFDGRRLLLERQDDTITGINKLGFPVGFPKFIEEVALDFSQNFLIDGELIGDTLYAFDLLSLGGKDLRSSGYAERSLHLLNLLAPHHQPHIVMVESAFLPLQKRQLLERLQRDGREGIVFKQLDAPYSAGRPASGGSQFKFKFCASVSCLVSHHNAKRSVGLELIDGDHTISIGNVTIPANFDVPLVGTVVEVRYLYAFQGGSLFQPVYLGRRDDVSPLECLASQLKFKSEPEQEAA